MKRSQLTGKTIVPDPPIHSRPPGAFLTRKSLLRAFSEFIPLSQQFSDVQSNVRLKLEHALEGVGVRDNLAFPCVISSITSVEEGRVDRDKCVVEIALQISISVGVDDLEGIWVGDRHVVRSEPYEGSCGASGRCGSVSSH